MKKMGVEFFPINSEKKYFSHTLYFFLLLFFFSFFPLLTK